MRPDPYPDLIAVSDNNSISSQLTRHYYWNVNNKLMTMEEHSKRQQCPFLSLMPFSVARTYLLFHIRHLEYFVKNSDTLLLLFFCSKSVRMEIPAV